MAKKTTKAYHHGDLREALIKAGRAILEKDGVEALTLRACARKAGVSHAAPQHHFASINDLLAEIAATGFEDFVKALDGVRRVRPRRWKSSRPWDRAMWLLRGKGRRFTS